MTIQVEKLRYPITIEVPEDYWTITTTANIGKEEVDIHWHHNEE